LLGFRDWSVVAITFERENSYRINGNRGKGASAKKIRDNVSKHGRTIYWIIFDQKGNVVDKGAGPGRATIPNSVFEKLVPDVPRNESVKAVLAALREGKSDKAARSLEWTGYPVKQEKRDLSGTFKLIVATEDGAEFESTLSLIDTGTRLSGYLIAPDGQKVALKSPNVEKEEVTFGVTFGEGDEGISFTFRGKMGPTGVRGLLTPEE